MKSPADQKIIQIDLTNACSHSCSNCTRFCGHHEKPFMMDFETFKEAVDSLVDFPGIVGIMGGEPTLHPEFDRFVAYYASKIGSEKRSRRGREPIVDFSLYRTEEVSQPIGKRGLFSSLGKGYYKHFELIQEVFDYQCINDHRNPGLHQALLVSRKELGIADEEWVPLRDQCWIQNLWSSSITPKGAFFCEVAGALDALFKGPGGWDVNSDWWKRTPDQFGEQLNWCEFCGAALQVPRRPANEERDDVSPALLEKLASVNSPKLKKQKVAVLDLDSYSVEKYYCAPSDEWYLPQGDNQQRIAGTNQSLYPQRIVALVVAQDGSLPDDFSETVKQFDQTIVACQKWFTSTVSRAIISGGKVLEVDRYEKVQSILSKAVDQYRLNDWVVLFDADTALRDDFADQVRRFILNPGCLYYQGRVAENDLSSDRGQREKQQTCGELFFLFNVRASALRKVPKDNASFADWWPTEKQIDLNRWLEHSTLFDQKSLEGDMLARHMASLWSALTSCHEQVVMFGAGQHACWLIKLFEHYELPMPTHIVDDATAGGQLLGRAVDSPEAIKSPEVLFISSSSKRVTAILIDRCRAVWGESVRVIDPYVHFPKNAYRRIIPE